MSLISLIEEHRLIRRLVLIWAVVVITVVTHKIFWNPPDISAGTATAYSVTIGLLGTVIALYKWSREKEDERRHVERLACITKPAEETPPGGES